MVPRNPVWRCTYETCYNRSSSAMCNRCYTIHCFSSTVKYLWLSKTASLLMVYEQWLTDHCWSTGNLSHVNDKVVSQSLTYTTLIIFDNNNNNDSKATFESVNTWKQIYTAPYIASKSEVHDDRGVTPYVIIHRMPWQTNQSPN